MYDEVLCEKNQRSEDGAMSRLSEPSDPDLPAIERKIQNADDDSCNRQNSCRNIRIDQSVQVMGEEPTLVRLDSRFGFKPVF